MSVITIIVTINILDGKERKVVRVNQDEFYLHCTMYKVHIISNFTHTLKTLNKRSYYISNILYFRLFFFYSAVQGCH